MLRTIVSHLETVDPKVRRNLKKSSRSGKHCFNGFPRHFHSVEIRPGKAIFHRADFALAVGAIRWPIAIRLTKNPPFTP